MRPKLLKIRKAVNVPFSFTKQSASVAIPHIWISIENPGDEATKLRPNDARKNFLRLQVADTDDKTAPGAITENQAEDLLRFVVRHAHPNLTVIINCTAGVSRSAAVAAALTNLSGMDDTPFFKNYSPNSLIYRTMWNVGGDLLGGKPEKEITNG